MNHAVNSKKFEKDGPPPHAPAYGYRAKRTYQYFPDPHVYFDVHRKVYFYPSGDQWKMSETLPEDIQLYGCNYVRIETDSSEPYIQFKEHKEKYPSGRLKKGKDEWASH